jgi:hypothetical protein
VATKTKNMKNKRFTGKTDFKGNKIFENDTITCLYEIGSPDGVVKFIKDGFFIEDSDGDLLEIDSVLKNLCYKK